MCLPRPAPAAIFYALTFPVQRPQLFVLSWPYFPQLQVRLAVCSLLFAVCLQRSGTQLDIAAELLVHLRSTCACAVLPGLWHRSLLGQSAAALPCRDAALTRRRLSYHPLSRS